MNFITILKNYLFSNNLSLTNPSYRFSSIFYKRFTIDFLLRMFIFLPFGIFLAILVKNGYFKEIADTMLQSGQNVYGYLVVIFVYVPIVLFFISSLISSLIGSILKRTVFTPDFDEQPILPQNYLEAFLSSWKNLWYLTVETFVILFMSKIIIEWVFMNIMNVSFMSILKALFITVVTSAILALLVSLPWISSKKKIKTIDNNTVIN